ncbi:hypothetical protein EVJ58_g3046 [Rhodofomes roseus]|uniref:Malonyl-CoA:ACP transacylase (MAT) domain-containing protein n=1 Tax=Rhodofomes roseus TaxID=34475 RepID=A0A4Y9YNS0_9APHY|nr:hypothetical protein EVJ58_g3046 [Rhodofomes roseus]
MPDGGSVATLTVEAVPTARRADVLEEPTGVTIHLPPKPAHAADAAPVVLALSGDSVDAVEELRQRYVHALTDGTMSLVDVASSATCANGPPGKYRLAVSSKSREELAEKLSAAQVVPVPDSPRKVIFLFSGQGGQSFGMGAALYRAVPTFRWAVDECQDKLVSWGFEEMLPFIQGTLSKDESGPVLEAEHTALFALEYGLARMWTAWGVKPDVVLGQSLGEYSALVWSDVISLDDGLRLVWQRARLTRERCPRGSSGMLVIMAAPSVIEETIREDPCYDKLSIACHNSDTNGIVGGDMEQLKVLEQVCQQKGWWHRMLTVPYAYHTTCMEPILDEMFNLGKTVTFSPPTVPIAAALRGIVVEPGDQSAFQVTFQPDYFAQHARRPVLFQESIYALAARDPALASEGIWLEIGPHTTILPLLRIHRAVKEECVQMGSLRRGEVDEEVLCQALARLYCAGATANWHNVFRELASPRV